MTDTTFRPGGMIGMLDYRAAKLYKLVVAFPLSLIATGINIALILGSFLITQGLSASIAANHPALAGYHVIHLALAWLSLELISLIFQIIWFNAVIPTVEKSFFFLIDVMPGEGRTYDQAMAVVRNGDLARLILKMDDVENWTFSDTEQFVKRLSLVSRLFYGEQIKERVDKRVDLVRDALRERQGKPLSRREIDEICKPVDAKISRQEKF
jgi:hypothetical protein